MVLTLSDGPVMIGMLWKRLVDRMKPRPGLAPENEITVELNKGPKADQDSRDRLAAVLYPELKRMASAHMRRERSDHTLQPTALVNELYLNLMRRSDVTWTSRDHFLLAASHAMHLLLVDHARARKAQKRGGSWSRLEIDDLHGGVSANQAIEILELDELMTRLARQEPRMAKVVEMKFFGGLTFSEIGGALEIDERTAKRDWTLAKAWLRGQLKSSEPNDSSGMGED